MTYNFPNLSKLARGLKDVQDVAEGAYSLGRTLGKRVRELYPETKTRDIEIYRDSGGRGSKRARSVGSRFLGDCGSDGLPMERVFKARLRYFDRNLTLPDSGVNVGKLDGNIWSANSIFDPDQTGGGHKACGFDQFMGMYDHYTVVSCTINLWLYNADSIAHPIVGIATCQEAVLKTEAQAYIESGCTKYKVISISGQPNSLTVLSASVEPGKFLGRPDPLSEDNLRGTATTNPAEQVYFHFFKQPVTNITCGYTMYTVQIDYDCIFTEPKRLAAS